MRLSIPQKHPSSQIYSKGLVSGYASFFEIRDMHGDRITPGAFTKSLKNWHFQRSCPKMLWQHDIRQPIGIWTSLREDNQGLYVQGRLALGTHRADEAYVLLKQGVLDSLSIGFRAKKIHRDQKTGGRLIREVDLIEVSLVTYAANPKARIHHIKTI